MWYTTPCVSETNRFCPRPALVYCIVPVLFGYSGEEELGTGVESKGQKRGHRISRREVNPRDTPVAAAILHLKALLESCTSTTQDLVPSKAMVFLVGRVAASCGGCILAAAAATASAGHGAEVCSDTLSITILFLSMWPHWQQKEATHLCHWCRRRRHVSPCTRSQQHRVQMVYPRLFSAGLLPCCCTVSQVIREVITERYAAAAPYRSVTIHCFLRPSRYACVKLSVEALSALGISGTCWRNTRCTTLHVSVEVMSATRLPRSLQT